MQKVCAVVVTFNRKKLLLKCIDALLNQTYKIKAIYIVDNASTDGTFEYLVDEFSGLTELNISRNLYSCTINDIVIYFHKLLNNTGSGGGFYHGLKNARELNQYDLFWLMDDDGYPSKTCIEKLIPYTNDHDYVMPVSIDIEDHTQLSWPVKLKNKKTSRSYEALQKSWGSILNFVFPYNGSLLSKKIVDSVGYPKAELFLWGDEYEHYWRCKKNKFNPITVTNSAFYHPANKLNFEPILFGLYEVPDTDINWRFVCLIRNSTYIYWNYTNKFNIILKGFIYTYYILLKKRNLKKYSLYLKCVIDGIKGNFTRHLNYIK
ncbi:glycosyltransferase [bacterium]|nr:MAG: glycosyltransferase [bacterium]